jgi:hypothetical protein
MAKLRSTKVSGCVALDLSSLFNRPHNSLEIGGGDNPSFATWFEEDAVMAEGIPFVVKRGGNDVLVTSNRTENEFDIGGINACGGSLHFLVWGYNYPDEAAKLAVIFSDGSKQEWELPLSEWTETKSPAAFDFKNTAGRFQHAAITHAVVKVEHRDKEIASIVSTSGLYGLVAVTLDTR